MISALYFQNSDSVIIASGDNEAHHCFGVSFELLEMLSTFSFTNSDIFIVASSEKDFIVWTDGDIRHFICVSL